MQGRRTGTPGNVKGNAYIVSELRRLGLKPAGDTGSYLQRVPLSSYAADSSRATLGSARASWRCGRTTIPTRRNSRCRPARSTARQLVYIGGPADSARVPPREALQGKLVVYNSGGSGNNLGAPDLHPDGQLGLVSGIAVTGVDTVIATFEQVFRTPQDRGQGRISPSRPASPSPASSSCPRPASRSSSASRSTSSGRATPAPPIQGEVTFEESDLGREQRGRGAGGIGSGAPRPVRRARRAQRRHRHRAPGGPRFAPGVQHRHAAPRRQRPAGRARTPSRRRGSARWWTACGSCGPRGWTRSSTAPTTMARARWRCSRSPRPRCGATRGRSARCSSSGTPGRSRGSRARAGSPTTRRCRAIRSSPRSTST